MRRPATGDGPRRSGPQRLPQAGHHVGEDGHLGLTGAGLVVAGIGLGRAGVWAGRRRWLVLATGLYVFVVLLPGIVAPFVVGRIVIGAWMLLFAAIGHAMTVRVPGVPVR